MANHDLKIHLGCGKRVLPGFVHVDKADFAHIDHRHDVKLLPFFEDGCAELIYASHVLEYFDRQEATLVLKEWARVLKKGGTLRIAVPDFDALKEVYDGNKDLDMILGPLFGRMEIKTPKNPRTIYHKTVYNFRALKILLEKCGFEKIEKYDWKKTIQLKVDDHSQSYVPHMDKAKGKLISLNLEAKKA